MQAWSLNWVRTKSKAVELCAGVPYVIFGNLTYLRLSFILIKGTSNTKQWLTASGTMDPVLRLCFYAKYLMGGLVFCLLYFLIAAVVLESRGLQAAEVNVYSGRKEALIRPVLDRYTEHTGVKVNLVSGKAEQLRERLIVEGRNSPADVLITADVANLHRSMLAGLLRPIESKILSRRIPLTYRDPTKQWFGLSLRARVFVFSTDRVGRKELSTYENLAEPKWRGRIAVRSSSNVYNQSLIASMIATHGIASTENWGRGLVANFARSPQGGDTDQIRAVASGEADIAIVNSYYYGRLMGSSRKRDKGLVEKTALFFPNQDGRGTHVNISGAAVTASAKNLREAVGLLEFLSSSEGQHLFAELNHEFPVSNDVDRSPIVSSWGIFKADELKLALLGEYNGDAIRLADRVGWR